MKVSGLQNLLSLAREVASDEKTNSKVAPKSGIEVVPRVKKVGYADR